MTMLQMLAEMVGTKELLGLVAFTKLVYTIEMRTTCFPIWGWFVGKLLATVAAGIKCCERGGRLRGLRLRRAGVGGWYVSGSVERAIEAAIEGGA